MAENTNPEGSVRGVLDIEGATTALTEILTRDNGNSEQQEPQQEVLEEDAGLDESEYLDAETDDLAGDEAEESELADLDDEDYEQEAPIEPRRYQVKAAGETHEVTEEELISGYQRQADYTKGKQELSETRKQLDSELQAAQAERQRMKQTLDAVQAQLQTAGVPAPDEELREIDPTEYLLQKDAYEKHLQKVRAVAVERKRIADQEQQQYEQALEEMRQREEVSLLEKIPEWNDNQKRAEDITGMMSYAQSSLGYTKEELEQIFDSRLVLALQKLYKYESAAAPDSKARKKVSQARTIKSGQRQSRKQPPKRVQQARKRLKQSGHVNDLASFLLSDSQQRS